MCLTANEERAGKRVMLVDQEGPTHKPGLFTKEMSLDTE